MQSLSKLHLAILFILAVIFTVSCIDAESPNRKVDAGARERAAADGKFTPEENNDIAHEFFDTAWNEGDLKGVAYILADDVIDHSPVPGEHEGPEKFAQIVGMFRAALPDVVMTVEDEIYSGDRVVHRWLVQGTHTGGPLLGVPATNQKIHLSGITIIRMEDGYFKERWTQLDMIGLLTQLGLVPPPGGKPE